MAGDAAIHKAQTRMDAWWSSVTRSPTADTQSIWRKYFAIQTLFGRTPGRQLSDLAPLPSPSHGGGVGHETKRKNSGTRLHPCSAEAASVSDIHETNERSYLNIKRRGLHLAMTMLEERLRAAEQERQKKDEERKRKQAEAVAHALHTAPASAPAFVSEVVDTPARKQLPS